MSQRHGRAVMPYGRFCGTQVRFLPDGTLTTQAAWLAETAPIEVRAKFWWLFESLLSEMRYRGFPTNRFDEVAEPAGADRGGEDAEGAFVPAVRSGKTERAKIARNAAAVQQALILETRPAGRKFRF